MRPWGHWGLGVPGVLGFLGPWGCWGLGGPGVVGDLLLFNVTFILLLCFFFAGTFLFSVQFLLNITALFLFNVTILLVTFLCFLLKPARENKKLSGGQNNRTKTDDYTIL